MPQGNLSWEKDWKREGSRETYYSQGFVTARFQIHPLGKKSEYKEVLLVVKKGRKKVP